MCYVAMCNIDSTNRSNWADSRHQGALFFNGKARPRGPHKHTPRFLVPARRSAGVLPGSFGGPLGQLFEDTKRGY